MFSALTWNVLHRIHAENWSDPTIAHHPEEAQRVAGITARIAARPETVIALQEVSGDQLASLRDALPARSIFAFRYPRIPRPRHRPTPLVDPAEYLVMIADASATQVAAEASRTDPGKGLLAIATHGLLVVNTHVTYGEASTAQLGRLRDLVVTSGEPAIVLGDFNADRDTVGVALGDRFVTASVAASALPTRPRHGSDKSASIDHVFAYRRELGEAQVEDAGGLSDHNLVSVTLRA